MKISVLIPIYRVEKYISRCVYSLIGQNDLDETEIIFVDDASPDHSIEILNTILEENPEFKKKTKIIRHNVNKGLSAARNTGISNSKGDYILFLDSDDTLAENSIGSLKEVIKKESIDIIVYGMQFIYSDGFRKVVGGNHVPKSKEDYFKAVISRDCLVTVCGKLYSRRLFDQVRFIEGLNYGEDYATLPRLIYTADRIVDISEKIFYNYYQDNMSSYTQSQIGEKQIENILLAINILSEFFKRSQIGSNKKTIELLKIRNKVFLLEYVEKKYIERIQDIFPECNGISISMPFKHRIVWELSRRNYLNSLSAYLNFGRKLKSLLRI